MDTIINIVVSNLEKVRSELMAKINEIIISGGGTVEDEVQNYC